MKQHDTNDRRTDFIYAIQELVDAVWDYQFVDEEYVHKETADAQEGRAKMERAVQKIMLMGKAPRPPSRAELDEIFGWVRA